MKLNLSERIVDTYQFQVRVKTEERETVIQRHSLYPRRALSFI